MVREWSLFTKKEVPNYAQIFFDGDDELPCDTQTDTQTLPQILPHPLMRAVKIRHKPVYCLLFDSTTPYNRHDRNVRCCAARHNTVAVLETTKGSYIDSQFIVT